MRRNFLLAILCSLVTLLTFGLNSRLSADAAPTQTPALGQLKVCKVAGRGVLPGTIFTINVNGTPYSVPAGQPGLCVLAGQFPLDTNVTVQEVIPAGYVVSSIQVLPKTRKVGKDTGLGKVVVKIGTGVTEVIHTNALRGNEGKDEEEKNEGKDEEEKKEETGQGGLEICKDADSAGVSGNFTFAFGGRSTTIPVGTCTMIISVAVGPLTVTEVARSGYVLTDIYTIPADRLISENLSARSATVTIVQGPSSSQTIVVFRNRSVNS